MSQSYRVAVIGRTGRGDYGHGLDTVWRAVPSASLVAVADDNKAGLAAAAQRLQVDQVFSDYRVMLDQVKPDIVSICPRWLDAHHEIVLAAAERGIHMYLEKPLCRTLAEADAMVAACERTHVKLAVAHQTHYSPKLQMVQQLLAVGEIGKVLEIRARGKEDARGGGEDLWVLGSHLMDMIRVLGGQPAWCFANVTQAGHSLQPGDVQEGNEGIGPLAGDAVHAMYGLPNEATAYFGSLRGMAGKVSRFGLQVHGSQGILEILTGFLPSVKILKDPSWSPGRSGIAWQDVSSAGIGEPEPLTDGAANGGVAHSGNLQAVQDLMAAIESDRQPLCSVYDARAAIEMIVAVFASQRAGGPIPLPLKQRGNPLADWPLTE